MDAPYHVEEYRRIEGYNQRIIEFGIYKTGEGMLVRGEDVVFLHHICDLLNEDVNGRDVHR